MALTGKKYEKFYETTGSGSDKIDSTKLTNIEAAWDGEKAEGCQKYIDDPILAPLIFQLQQMQDELDYLRTEIESNKDNKTVIGSSTTLSFGDLTETTVRGVVTYTIDMTATRDFGGKTGSQTKSVTLTLT